jgi:FdhD protein
MKSMAPQARVTPVRIIRIQADASTDAREDLVVTEAPLEIRLGHGPAGFRQQQSISVTMRTPGHDLELALGFLYGEGLIRSHDDLAHLDHCSQVAAEEERGNVVKAELKAHLPFDAARLQRHFYSTSSCGVCGKASIAALEAQGCATIPDSGHRWAPGTLYGLPERIRAEQVVFRHTGGIHSAALLSADGQTFLLREDVGRHNAVDKVIGAQLTLGKLPLQDHCLFLSGRAGFELLQKAAMAGIPLVAAIGAPSSLAVATAVRYGITLLGFVKNDRLNIYAGEERIAMG